MTRRKSNHTEADFWGQVVKDPRGGCWLWQGPLHKGYGRVNFLGKRWFAHRLAYHLLWGSIPDGKDLDHLCCHGNCVYPWHLEPVTNEENNRRKVLRRRQDRPVRTTEAALARSSASRLPPHMAARRQAWYEQWLKSFRPVFRYSQLT